MVGERGFEPPTPLVPNYQGQNSKCFTWCRLGTRTPFFLSLSCTEVVPKILASLHCAEPCLRPAKSALDPRENFLASVDSDKPSRKLLARIARIVAEPPTFRL